MTKLRKINCLIISTLLVIVSCFVAYTLDKGHRDDAAKKEAYFMSTLVVLSDAKVGETLDEVIKRNTWDYFDETLLDLYLDAGSENRQLSEFLTLTWEGEKCFKRWKLIENNSHQVSLFDEDLLMFSEGDGVQWLSGRELLSARAKSVYGDRR